MTTTTELYRFQQRKRVGAATADDLRHSQPVFLSNPHCNNRHGLLIIHGFMSTPCSMKPLTDVLYPHVSHITCPLLSGCGQHPDTARDIQATQLQTDIRQAYLSLQQHCDHVTVIGQSLGGALAVTLAREFPQIKHLFLLAPALYPPVLLQHASLIRRILNCIGIHYLPNRAGDINNQETFELSYKKIPLAAYFPLLNCILTAQASLPDIHMPTTVFSGTKDHVLNTKHLPTIIQQLGAPEKKLVWLPRSYHVVSKDNDIDVIIKTVLASLTQ